MAVKVLIKRKIKDGKINDASKLLIKARYNAMGQPGYISSETLSGCDDSNNCVSYIHVAENRGLGPMEK